MPVRVLQNSTTRLQSSIISASIRKNHSSFHALWIIEATTACSVNTVSSSLMGSLTRAISRYQIAGTSGISTRECRTAPTSASRKRRSCGPSIPVLQSVIARRWPACLSASGSTISRWIARKRKKDHCWSSRPTTRRSSTTWIRLISFPTRCRKCEKYSRLLPRCYTAAPDAPARRRRGHVAGRAIVGDRA